MHAVLQRCRPVVLVPRGYIAAQSIHSTGAAVDVILVALPIKNEPVSNLKPLSGPCNDRAARERDDELDMGTAFDCFDEMSYTDSPDITAVQRENRRLLIAAMSAHKFKNYFREWWHFTFVGLPALPSAGFRGHAMTPCSGGMSLEIDNQLRS